MIAYNIRSRSMYELVSKINVNLYIRSYEIVGKQMKKRHDLILLNVNQQIQSFLSEHCEVTMIKGA